MENHFKMFINGRWIDSSSRESIPVINPANEETLGRLPVATTADLDSALESAAKGFEVWRKTSVADRARLLRTTAQLLRDRLDAIAVALTLEQGKTLREARLEVDDASDLLEWFAEEGKRAYGRIIPSADGRAEHRVIKEPVGPAVMFTPWNNPIAEPALSLAAALAAGCSAIIKPSEETPGSAVALVKAMQDAGLPDGVVNVVFGVPSEISEYLIPSPVIRKVTFTGSVPVGKKLAAMAAAEMKSFTMELGGNAPVIIFEDVDVKTVAKVVSQRKYRNAGQSCSAPNRFYVHDDIFDDFASEMIAIAESLRIGDGLTPEHDMGSMANRRRIDFMETLMHDAHANGASVATGGRKVGNEGYFWEPTVLVDVPENARVIRDEIFGPIAPLARFSDIDDVVARSNAVNVGLASYVFTTSREKSTAVSKALKFGQVGVNNMIISVAEGPFGGVKDSGIGRVGGSEGLDQYFDIKFVAESI